MASTSAKSSSPSRRPFVPRRGEPLAPAFAVKPDGAYLITGAFGGFGKVLAEWLVEMRRASPRAHQPQRRLHAGSRSFVENLQRRGVECAGRPGRRRLAEDVKRLLAEIRAGAQPLRGIFHLAMVIDDAPLAALTRERMRTVMAPKAYGAWLLHEGTQASTLDCFVMFSSVSSIFGNPAQGNYGAANAFLDSLAHHRRALGLPALAINWGVLGGEGYVARNERVAEFLARQGTTALTGRSHDASRILPHRRQHAGGRDPRGLGEMAAILPRHAGEPAARAHLRGRRRPGKRRRDQRLAARSSRRAGRTRTVIAAAVRDVVGSVLRVKPESLRDDQPLTDLGLDSLMGVEIENSIEAPSASLFRRPA